MARNFWRDAVDVDSVSPEEIGVHEPQVDEAGAEHYWGLARFSFFREATVEVETARVELGGVTIDEIVLQVERAESTAGAVSAEEARNLPGPQCDVTHGETMRVMLNAQAGRRILDACAAAGRKPEFVIHLQLRRHFERLEPPVVFGVRVRPRYKYLPEFDIDLSTEFAKEGDQSTIEVAYPKPSRRSAAKSDGTLVLAQIAPGFGGRDASFAHFVETPGDDEPESAAVPVVRRIRFDLDVPNQILRYVLSFCLAVESGSARAEFEITEDAGSCFAVVEDQVFQSLSQIEPERLVLSYDHLKFALENRADIRQQLAELVHLGATVRIAYTIERLESSGAPSRPQTSVRVFNLELQLDLRTNYHLVLNNTGDTRSLFRSEVLAGEVLGGEVLGPDAGATRYAPPTEPFRTAFLLSNEDHAAGGAPAAHFDQQLLEFEIRGFSAPASRFEARLMRDGIALPLSEIRPEAPSGPTGAVSTWRFETPLSAIFPPEERGRQQVIDAQLEIRLASSEGGPGEIQSIPVSVSIDYVRATNFICVDWGASSIAAGFANRAQEQENLITSGPELLRLGAVAKRARPHSAASSGATALDEDSDDLIQSTVFLGDHPVDMRTEIAPFSFLDLRVGLDSGLERRLQQLQRQYSISLPALPQHLYDKSGQVLTNLKRLLAVNEDVVRLREPVPRLNEQGRLEERYDVDISRLICEALDEMMSLYLVESLIELGGGGEADQRFGFDLMRELFQHEISLILTHPCGLTHDLVERYREAGRYALARLDRGGLEPLELDATEEAVASETRYAVIPVPESLAAAFHVYQSREPGQKPIEEGLLIALDLGAGTFDLSAIDVNPEAAAAAGARWSILLQYGIAVGGGELDRLLTEFVHYALLALAAEDRSGALKYQTPLVGEPADAAKRGRAARAEESNREQIRREYMRALEKAKIDISDRAFKNFEATDHWSWKPEDRLEIEVGSSVDSYRPITIETAGKRIEDGQVLVDVADGAVRLIARRRVSDDGAESYTAYMLSISNVFMELNDRRFAAQEQTQLGNLDQARRRIVQLSALIGAELPTHSIAHLRETRRPDEPLYFSVTGRAALWPPIFERVVDVARRHNAAILPNRDASAKAKPMGASDMKLAVMNGAYGLALQRSYLSAPAPEAPLALLVLNYRGSDAVIKHALLLENFDDSEWSAPIPISQGDYLQLSRVAPGIDKLRHALATDDDWLERKCRKDLLNHAMTPDGLGGAIARVDSVQIKPRRDIDPDSKQVRITAVDFRVGQGGASTMRVPRSSRLS
ncbi:MAG: hypothetical protein MRY74_14590 [Neomegalonema sp.]|nr:hypothetical protein [Neomegalonema sp.]